MIIKWSEKSKDDIQRLYNFLFAANPDAVTEVISNIRKHTLLLQDQPRLGRILSQYEGRDIRSSLMGRYEIRYEVAADTLYILRIWHTREER